MFLDDQSYTQFCGLGIFDHNVFINRPRSTKLAIHHFTVVCLVAWPLNGSEAGVDLVLIQTSLLLLCKSGSSYAN